MIKRMKERYRVTSGGGTEGPSESRGGIDGSLFRGTMMQRRPMEERTGVPCCRSCKGGYKKEVDESTGEWESAKHSRLFKGGEKGGVKLSACTPMTKTEGNGSSKNLPRDVEGCSVKKLRTQWRKKRCPTHNGHTAGMRKPTCQTRDILLDKGGPTVSTTYGELGTEG